jgi:hypothetical protein
VPVGKLRKLPFPSLALLMMAWGSFGWYIQEPDSPRAGWLLGVVLVGGICAAFINPITTFNRLINRYFASDTIAFLSVFMLAAAVTMICFWLQIFLYILTIMAAEALARIDLRTGDASEPKIFVTLITTSMLGLLIGCLSNELVHGHLQHLGQLDVIFR